MAIKSKSRSKSRHASKAPRRSPVAVPKPFFQRRWVQLVAVFLVGMLVVATFVWAVNGLRRENAQKAATTAKLSRQEALSLWQATLEGQIGAVGQLQGVGSPVIAPTLSSALNSLSQGKKPSVKATDLQSESKGLRKAADAIDGFDLSGTITSHPGFDLAGSTALTMSKTQIVAGLRGLEQAAKLAVLAMDANGTTKTQLAASAKTIADTSATLIQTGWNQYASVLSENGLSPGGSPSGGLGLGG